MITRSLDLSVPPERAFTAWTRDIHLWWPAGHTRHQGRIELGRERFVERWDGGERDLGKVVEWSPPDRLVYDFYLGSSADEPTRVFIRFTATDRGTRVDIEHRRHKVDAQRFERSAVGYRRAWPDLEAHFTRFVEKT